MGVRRRRVKRSEKVAKQQARQQAQARRPSMPAIASPKWVTVDPNARLPKDITAKGRDAREEKKKHRRRHSAQHHAKKGGVNGRHRSLADSDDEDEEEEEDTPLIARFIAPTAGTLLI